MKIYFLFFLLLFYFSSPIHAQTNDSTNVVTIKTQNKGMYIGKLLNITTDSIFIDNNDFGQLAFSKSKVKYILNGLIPSHFTETTNSSVPYYVQTARPNGAGNHYYKNYYIFGNEFNYGLSDNVNATFGFETASLIFDSGNRIPLIQMGLKYGVAAAELFHVGLSTKYYFNSEGSALMLSSPFTFGGNRTNLTFSPTYLYADGSGLFGVFANVSLGVSPKSRFIVDIAFFDSVKLPTFLYEYIFNSGFSISVGLFVVEEIAIPNLSFSIPFGRWKK